MALYTLSPVAKQQFLDNSGNPLANGRIYTFAAGTTTALTTYQTSAGTAWGAYVQLDSVGRPQTGSIYLQPGTSYKFRALTSASVQLWEQDNVAAVPPSAVNVDITGTAGVNLAAGDVVYMSKGDGSLTPGSWYLTDADLAYASVSASMVGMVPAAIAVGDTGTIRLEGDVDVTGPLTPGADYYVSATAGALTATAPTNLRFIGQAKSVGVITISPNPPLAPSIDPKIKSFCNGRLSLTTGVPVTTLDVTAATTLYWVPYMGNEVAVYSGSAWVALPLAQLSVAVPATTNTMYDVFVDYNSGAPVLSLTAWTSITTRATALTTQDGVYVLTGSTGKRYVGSFCTTAVSGQTEDSFANRLVWNYYNRVDTALRYLEAAANWNYSTATWREANGATNRVAIVTGVSEDQIDVRVTGVMTNSAGVAQAQVGVGDNVTNAPSANATRTVNASVPGTGYSPVIAHLVAYPAVGYRFYAWLEIDNTGAGVTTWIGSSATLGHTGIEATWRR